MTKHHLTVNAALNRIPGHRGERFVELFHHGTLSIELYAPRGTDPQQPHTRDEVYVVAQGKGQFLNGGVRHGFGPGDVLFVPAGVVHRFDVLPDGSHKRTIEQGFEMGRPSLIALSLEIEAGKLSIVRVGGHAVRVAEGKIEV